MSADHTYQTTTLAAYPSWATTTSTATAPVFAYPGGKTRLSRTFVPYFPQTGGTFCDVFAGRGNVFFAAASTLQYGSWWINDIRTIPWFTNMLMCGDSVEVVERTRANYERLSAAPESVEAILNEPRMTYSGGGWAAGFGSDVNIVSRDTYGKRLIAGQRLLTQCGARFTDWDWKRVVEQLDEDDFAYLDPPYLNASVRPYSATDLNHREMVDMLACAKFSWALSEYPDPLYIEAFGHPIWQQEQSCAMSVNRRTDRRMECLWVRASGDRTSGGLTLTM
jgi:site-specific DNA-adenine methylase